MYKTTHACPKCKNKSIQLVEVWDGATITWEVENGIFDKSYGNLEPGDPTKVCGLCPKCDHRWTLRGGKQIIDVAEPL